MNTLFVFLVRRDQIAQLVAYVLMGFLVIALQVGFTGGNGRPSAGDTSAAPLTVRTADAALAR
ncbi:MAG TPA: hypothetical protein VEB66_02770 [Opitutaceae bacterium]|nr:hypothetical protein [Opitutaceae bacterium]